MLMPLPGDYTPHSLTLPLPPALGGQEDAVLLRHALQCGTKQWGELGRSGQLKRNNKSCCNRYIFLRRKFTDRFRQNFLQKHLGVAAQPQNITFNRHSQPLLCQDVKHQQQQQQQQQRSEGVGAAALAFGGLSYEECVTAFLAPHARCCLPPAPPNLSSLATPPPASQAPPPVSQGATFSAVADCTYEFPFAQDAFPVAASSNTAALCRAVKRPRDDCPEVGAQKPLLGRESQLLQGGVVRGGTVQGGMVQGGMVCGSESRRQSVAEQFQQQGASSCVQAGEAALLGALLQEEHRQLQQGGAKSRVQQVDRPRVGSESALPDDVLLGFSSDEPAFTQRAPPSTQPLAALPAPMASPLAALRGSALCIGDSTSCCGDAARCIGDFAVHSMDRPRVGSESALPDDVLLGCSSDGPAFMQRAALSAPPPTQPHAVLPAPMAPVLAALLGSAACSTSSCITGSLVGSSALAVPLATVPQAERPAAPGAAGTAEPEWVVEQGGTMEEGHPHRQECFLTQEAALEQRTALASVVTSALHTPTNPTGAHMQAPIRARPAMLQQRFSTGGALPALCQPLAASLAHHGRYSGR
ncbi:unnamed protein product [Closterium sp. NIES-64]|nr:unnamed protein product [Closterium sp. NIES-64]